MKITVLLENVGCPLAEGAHGLSLFVETREHTLLFDAGPDGALLEKNAAALGADLTRVDTAVLSHAHYDHGGGMARFLELNRTAPLYLHHYGLESRRCTASGEDRDGWRDGLTAGGTERFRLTGEECRIDGELLLFSDIRTEDYLPERGPILCERRGEEIVPEDFSHEQNLLLTEGDTAVLLAGCAHRGILNILRRCEERLGRAPDAVLGGFHLTSPREGKAVEESVVRALGEELRHRESTRFFTGHCTGEGPYAILKGILGERLGYMSTGSVFTF